MFKENSKAIYLQIADRICDSILSGEYPPDERMPSVREMGSMLQVNPNTVMRTYDYLSQRDIIHNQRGIGYFVSSNAVEKVRALKISTWFESEIYDFFHQFYLLGMTPDELSKAYADYIAKQEKNK